MSEEQFKEILTKKQLLEAAAPELLQACEIVLEQIKHSRLSEFNIPQEYLERAIKKARGGK